MSEKANAKQKIDATNSKASEKTEPSGEKPKQNKKSERRTETAENREAAKLKQELEMLYKILTEN